MRPVKNEMFITLTVACSCNFVLHVVLLEIFLLLLGLSRFVSSLAR